MKRWILSLLLIMVLFTLYGCWNEEEPKTLASINSILYDFSDDGKFLVFVDLLKPLASGSGQGEEDIKKSSVGPVFSEGESIREAMNILTRSIEKRLFGGHNKIRFFSEKFSEQGIITLLELSARDILMDETPYMVVIKGEKAEEIFSASFGLSDIVGDYFDNLAALEKRNPSNAQVVTSLDFIKAYYLEGKQPVMGLVEIVANPAASSNESSGGASSEKSGEEKKIIQFEGLAAFKKDKLVGYLSADETMAYNMITDTVKKYFVSLAPGTKRTVVRISKTKAKINTFLENEKVSVKVNIKATIKVIEETGGLDISKPDDLKITEEKFNELMKRQIELTINRVQSDIASDIFGFGRMVNIQHPKSWPHYKENWDDKYFSEALVEVVVQSSVTRGGQIKKPLEVGN